LGILYEALEVIRVIYRVSSIWFIGTITLISQINSERDWKEGEIMTDETLKQYIVQNGAGHGHSDILKIGSDVDIPDRP